MKYMVSLEAHGEYNAKTQEHSLFPTDDIFEPRCSELKLDTKEMHEADEPQKGDGKSEIHNPMTQTASHNSQTNAPTEKFLTASSNINREGNCATG